MGKSIDVDVIRKHLRERVVKDIEEIRKIKIDLLKLAAAREDTELAEIANRLHLARCNLANTVTLRFLVNGVATAEHVEDCEGTDLPHDDG
jgi:hypothetical protein